jgi:pimeloyl-ACP methyl ester carboxylesterase
MLRRQLTATTSLPQLTMWASIMQSLFGWKIRSNIASGLFEPRDVLNAPIKNPKEYGLEYSTLERFGKNNELALWKCAHTSSAKDSKGTVFYFEGSKGHWGSEEHGYRVERIKALQAEGYDVIAVHLPGYGASKGTPSEKSFNLAIDDLIKWGRSERIALTEAVIMGSELGGSSAAVMAAKLTKQYIPPKLLALVSSPASVRDVICDAPDGSLSMGERIFAIQNPETFRDEIGFDVSRALKGVHSATQVLVIHGERDSSVPPHHAELIANASLNNPVHRTKLHIEPGKCNETISAQVIAGAISDARTNGIINGAAHYFRPTSAMVAKSHNESLSLASLPNRDRGTGYSAYI